MIIEKKKNFFAPLRAWKYLVKKPVTISRKDIFVKPREAADRYRGFHVNDWDKCVGCGTCAEICPTNAINMTPIDTLKQEDGKKPERPAIDYGRCSFCALCVDICTSDSLGMSKEYIHISKDAETFYFIPEADGIHQAVQKKGYDRDDVSELLDLERYEMDHIELEGRNESFIEIVKGFSKEKAIAEASRCVECGVCTNTCPANMNIPEYIKTVFEDDLGSGIDYLYRTNPLSNVCGRICTHKCEGACVLGNRGEAISIRWLKRFIVDNTPEDLYEEQVLAKVSKQSNGKVGIIGSGPAGLSAGYYLRTLGYEVDIYEEKPLAGGVIRYGAPEYRLPEEKVMKDISMIEKAGVKFHTNTKVGRDITLDQMKEKYDAVFASSGYWIPKKLKMPGADHHEIHYSTQFLAKARNYTRNMGDMPEIAQSCAVIGGGDVSFDVARTLARLQSIKYGKIDVKFIARKDEANLAASLDEKIEAKEESVAYHLERSPMEIVVDPMTNSIKGVKVSICENYVDENGKAQTKCDENNTELLEATQVYFAVGSEPDLGYLEKYMDQISVERNKIKIENGGQVKGLPWLFAGGDITKGPDIISAVNDGHKAADAIDKYLSELK